MGRGLIVVLDLRGMRRRGRRRRLWRRGSRYARPYRAALRNRRRRSIWIARRTFTTAEFERLGLGLAMHDHRLAPAGVACPAAKGQWVRRRNFARQGHALGPLGNRGHTGRVRLGLFSTDEFRDARTLDSALMRRAGLPGFSPIVALSGTDVIAELWRRASANAQTYLLLLRRFRAEIAAHEEAFGLERLYDICRIARRLCDPLNIGRVIARPFLGRTAAEFVWTSNREDFSMPPLRGVCSRARRARGARSSPSARSATFSPIATPDATKGQVEFLPCRSHFEVAWRDGRWRVYVRQSRRFRHRIRPSPRRSRICRLPGGFRRSSARNSSRRCGPTISAC